MINKYCIICKGSNNRILTGVYHVDTNDIKQLGIIDLNKFKESKLKYDDLKDTKSARLIGIANLFYGVPEYIDYKLVDLYVKAFDVCVDRAAKLNFECNVVFGEFYDTESTYSKQIVFRLHNKEYSLIKNSQFNATSVFENYCNIIYRLSLDIDVLNRLYANGYLLNQLTGELTSDSPSAMISQAMFGKYNLYRNDVNLQLVSNKTINLSILANKINCDNFLNRYIITKYALNTYKHLLSVISEQELAAITNLQESYFNNKIKALQLFLDTHSKLFNDILDYTIEKADVEDYFGNKIGLEYNNKHVLEIAIDRYNYSLENIVDLINIVRTIASNKANIHYNRNEVRRLIYTKKCPLVEDTKIVRLYADLAYDTKTGRNASIQMNKNKIYNRLYEAISVNAEGEIDLFFKQDAIEELNLYGNPLNGSCSCALGHIPGATSLI